MNNVVENEKIPDMINFLIQNPDVGENAKTGFLHSILNFYNGRKYLTQNQFVALQRMYENYSVDHSGWRANFGEDKKSTFKTCVDFYMKSKYYENIVSKVRKDANYIPTEKEYRAICENKYAAVIIREYGTPHKYQLGSLVRIRKRLDYGVGNIIEQIPGVDAAVSGSKKYKIYFASLNNSIELRERDIANVRECDLAKINETDRVLADT